VGRGRRTRDRSRHRFGRYSVRIVVHLHRTLTKEEAIRKPIIREIIKGMYRTGITRKKGRGDIVLRSKHNYLDLVFIIGVAVSGSGWGRETLDMGTLKINNQYCIRKKKMGCILEGIASEGVLSGAGCLVALNWSSGDRDNEITRKRQTRMVSHVRLRKPGSVYKRTGKRKSDHACDERVRKHSEH